MDYGENARIDMQEIEKIIISMIPKCIDYYKKLFYNTSNFETMNSQVTLAQRTNDWYKERMVRVTASKIYETMKNVDFYLIMK